MIRFGAFDAVHPNGIVALGDGKAIFGTRLITVNSRNEWTETSYLPPDDLYGYGYPEAIKKVLTEE